MIAFTHSIALVACKSVANAKRIAQRFVRALMDARMRRAQHEIEFYRRLNDHRHTVGLPPLSQDDFRGW